MATKRSIKSSTQKYLNIGEIRENTLIMDDNSVRSVLMVSSINFALKNEDEQNAIIGAYVNFLNNIDFPLQIIVHSRELNIDEYIEALKEKEKSQTNELLKAQTSEYIDYVSDLISMGKIMNKRFYIVIPYDPLSDKKRSFFSRFINIFNPISVINMREGKFLRLKKEIDRRINNVIAGLNSIGLNVVELDTQSLIELFYNTYNPMVSVNQELTETNQIRTQDQSQQ
ncbi:MAG: TraC family protein [bacterium]